MARSGRLVWVKSVLRAVPIYAMTADSLPPWARKEIDSICSKFFWAGRDESIRGKCMVAWEAMCRPSQLGVGGRWESLTLDSAATLYKQDGCGYIRRTKIELGANYQSKLTRKCMRSSKPPRSRWSATEDVPSSGKATGLMNSQFLRSPPRCRRLFLPELNGIKQSGKV